MHFNNLERIDENENEKDGYDSYDSIERNKYEFKVLYSNVVNFFYFLTYGIIIGIIISYL